MSSESSNQICSFQLECLQILRTFERSTPVKGAPLMLTVCFYPATAASTNASPLPGTCQHPRAPGRKEGSCPRLGSSSQSGLPVSSDAACPRWCTFCSSASSIFTFPSPSVTVWESLQLPLLYGVAASIGKALALLSDPPHPSPVRLFPISHLVFRSRLQASACFRWSSGWCAPTAAAATRRTPPAPATN